KRLTAGTRRLPFRFRRRSPLTAAENNQYDQSTRTYTCQGVRSVQTSKAMVWFVVLLTSAALCAQEAGTAVLFGTGSVFLNGAQVSNSSAVSGGDVIQTKENGAANINAPGSSIVIESNSI